MALQPIGLIVWLVLGLLAGWATGRFLRGSGYGWPVDMLIGALGALVGGFLLGVFGFPGQVGLAVALGVALVGAIALIVIVRAIRPGPNATADVEVEAEPAS
jgi:uncharacterized membrane protein YeaQ/YmgE (transglycosylase-associated protein family)